MARGQGKAKSGITWPVHAAASETITRMYCDMVYANVDMTADFWTLVHACFEPEAIEMSKKAYPYIASGAILDSTGYAVAGTTVQISGWFTHKMLPINGAFWSDHLPDYKEIVMDRAERVRKIVHDVGIVAAVVEYFHEYATPAATRYYFPSILSLAKNHADRLGQLSKRFREPADLGAMTPFIRHASETIAKWLLIPDGQKIGIGDCCILINNHEPDVYVEGQRFKLSIPSQKFRFIED